MNFENTQLLQYQDQPAPVSKFCWICSGTSDIDSSQEWVSPCTCRGFFKWVHQSCILNFVQEVQGGFIDMEVRCPNCDAEYIIVYYKLNYLVRTLNQLDTLFDLACPYLLCGVVAVFSFYLSSVLYGLLTIMQVMGTEEGTTMIENTNPLILISILPFAPICLLLGKMINWEKTLLIMTRRFISNYPLLRTIMPSFLCQPVDSIRMVHFHPDDNPNTIFCAALFLPTTATIVGRMLFGNSSYSNFKKTLLGGLVYIVVKNSLEMYRKRGNNMIRKTLKVSNYPVTTIDANN